MKITINVIGKQQGLRTFEDEYIKRLPWYITINELVLKKNLPEAQNKLEEGNLLMRNIPPQSFFILLDEQGKSLDSHEFADLLQVKMNTCQEIIFAIGGAYGHAQPIRDKADMLISLSPLTFPHKLARLILIEQLYRAYTIITNHPYHK